MQLKSLPTKNNRITSPFGPRVLNGVKSFHSGLDYGAVKAGVQGDPILSVADGTIVVSKVNGGGPTKGYGYYVIIQHDGFCSLYAHLKGLGLKVGTNVKAGDIIGFMGSSGNSTAAHLHFELRTGNFSAEFFKADVNGVQMFAVDPRPYLDLVVKKPVEPTKPIEVEWKRTIRDTFDLADEWIDYFEHLISQGGLAKFLPDAIVKLYKK